MMSYDSPIRIIERNMTEKLEDNVMNVIQSYGIDEYQEANLAMTWEELKTMKDKPVWIELLENGWKGWDVIAGFNEDDIGVAMVTVHNDDYYKNELGKTWQAYRKERKATGGSLIPEPKSKKIGDDTEIKWSENNGQ